MKNLFWNCYVWLVEKILLNEKRMKKCLKRFDIVMTDDEIRDLRQNMFDEMESLKE